MIRYTYDGWDVIREDSSLKGVTVYQNGLGIDDKLRSKNGTTVRYFLTDHLGSTVALTNSSGAITSSTTYDSFGNAIPKQAAGSAASGAGNAAPNIATSYRYTGREYDSDTGLYYYRNRWYDPETGRFISEDPIGFAGGDINLYGYVGNNPQNFIDPSGNYACNRQKRKSGSNNQQNDCEILADIAAATAKAVDAINGLSAAERTRDLMRRLIARLIGTAKNPDGTTRELNPHNPLDLRRAGNIGNNEFKDEGFKEKYQDGFNQVRHFTGGLWAGYLFGSLFGRIAMNSRENESDSADTRLNALSTYLGSNLIPKPERGVGSIRDGTSRTLPATPGYRALASQIRSRVCEAVN